MIGKLFVVAPRIVRLDLADGESVYVPFTKAKEPAVTAAHGKLVRLRLNARGRVGEVAVVVHPKG